MILVVLLWSSAGVVGKHIGTSLPALQVAEWRTIFGIQSLLPFLWLEKRHASSSPAGWELRRLLPLWMVGLAGYGLMQWLFFLSAQRTYASHLILIMALTPICTKLLRRLLFREDISGMFWSGAAVALAGSALILWPSSSGDASIWVGDLLALGAMISFSLYTEGMAHYARGYSLTAANVHVLTAGLLFLYVAGGVSGGSASASLFSLEAWTIMLPSTHIIGWLAFLGIGCTAFAYWGYGWAIRRLSASVALPFLYLQPLFGVALSAVWLGEALTLRFAMGSVLILLGLRVSQLRPTRRQHSQLPSQL